MICYIEGGERQSEEVCTAGSLWFTSRVSVAFFFVFLKQVPGKHQTNKQVTVLSIAIPPFLYLL